MPGQFGNKGGGRKTMEEEAIAIIKKRTYKEVMAEVLPDKLLAEKHLELLTVPKKVRRFVKGDLESEYEEVDSHAISKGLDMAYKIKGEYASEKVEHSGVIGFKQIVGTKVIKDNENNNIGVQNEDRQTDTGV